MLLIVAEVRCKTIVVCRWSPILTASETARILIFDEVISNRGRQTVELIARTISKLKGKVTVLFITQQIPRRLQVDEVFSFGDELLMTKVELVLEEK